MVRAYFRGYAGELGITMEQLLGLGQENPHNPSDPFNMAVLALRLSACANGVSRLHGKVSRRMWASLWPEVPEDEAPIGHVTNGIHPPTWFSTEISDLYREHLGETWLEDPARHESWDRVEAIPERELWDAHNRRKRALIEFARGRLKEQLNRSGAHPKEYTQVDEVLDPDALTIGFARRFATYKRATLLFSDIERLRRLAADPDRPVQFVFAGKAHPRDNHGKEFIRQIIQVSRQPEFRRRMVFIQDYDILVARHMVQGVDVWLNTPRRPLEASGTSGMKSTANGVLNFSVLDGWWDEGYNGENGWVIGEGEEYEDHEYQDSVESHALYNLLEKSIIPLYYDRNDHGYPAEWTRMMKQSVASICPFFNTNRMLEDYATTYYIPGMARSRRFRADRFALARSLRDWKKRMAEGWPSIHVLTVEAEADRGVRIGESLTVRVKLSLGPFSPADAVVEALHGRLDEKGSLTETHIVPLAFQEKTDDGVALYEGRIPCKSTGERGFQIRVLPRHDDQPHPFYSGLIKWWET
jgi:starch phosphorylase